jgi:undecaprenyl-diphosphatase
MFEAIVLGIIQGITEFFPISSTAHLVILPWLFEWSGDVNTLTFDVALHAGTLTSLLVCFWNDLKDMVKKSRRLLFLIVIGTVPAGLAGFYLHDYVEGVLRGPKTIAAMLVVFGFVMLFAERFRDGKNLKGLSFIDAVFIGLAQAVALVPGVSRSGITISAGLMRGVKRHEAARFSFLLSIPVIAGATVLEGRKLFGAPQEYNLVLFAVGFITSMITGVIAIKFLLKYLKRHTLNAFVVYRFVLAGMIVGWLWLRG